MPKNRAKKEKLTLPKGAFTFQEPDQADINLAEEGEEKKTRYASMLVYSGKPMRHWLFGDLAIDVNGLKFGKKSKFPVLEEHETDRKLGFSGKPKTDEGNVKLEKIRLLENSHANEFYENSKAGFPYQASISIKPLRIERLEEGSSAEVNNQKLKGPAMIIREAEYREGSACVFGVDSNTSTAAFNEDNFETFEIETVNFNDKSLEDFLFSDELQDQLEDAGFKVSGIRTPNHDGTEDSDWDGVSADMKAFISGYYKFNPDAEQGDEPVSSVDEMSAAMKRWIATRTLRGDPKAQTWTELCSYPVVNPTTNKLNKGGILSAYNLRGHSEAADAIAKKCKSLYKKHWNEDIDKSNNTEGGEDMPTTMSKEELEKNYPELVKQFREEGKSQAQPELDQKDKQIQELSQKNEQNEQRIAKLEKIDVQRRETALSDKASSIVNAKLEASNVPQKLHDKVRNQPNIDYRKYVDEDDDGNRTLNEAKFKEAVDAEIKDWPQDMSDNLVYGGGAFFREVDGDDSNEVNNREEDETVERLSKYIPKGKSNRKTVETSAE